MISVVLLWLLPFASICMLVFPIPTRSFSSLAPHSARMGRRRRMDWVKMAVVKNGSWMKCWTEARRSRWFPWYCTTTAQTASPRSSWRRIRCWEIFIMTSTWISNVLFGFHEKKSLSVDWYKLAPYFSLLGLFVVEILKMWLIDRLSDWLKIRLFSNSKSVVLWLN